MTPPGGIEWRADWADFADMIEARLDAGERQYGNTAAGRLSDELTREIAEELADVVGWTFWLWRRLRKIRRDLEALECRSPNRGSDLETSSSPEAEGSSQP